MSEEYKQRRLRGISPRGNFETSKNSASSSEEARIAADKRKTEVLKEARLRRRSEQQDTAEK